MPGDNPPSAIDDIDVQLRSPRPPRHGVYALTRTDPAVACKLLWCFVMNLSDRVRDLTDSLAQRLPGALDGTPPR